jgi:uncharacterized protein (TIGR03435 family)
MNLLTTFTLAALLTPQAPEPSQALAEPGPAFDAAAIRVSAPLSHTSFKTNPGRLSASGESLATLIQEAYGLSPFQIASVPNLGRFDIEATAEGRHTRAELLVMLQTLLAERFKLAAHREMREMPAMALLTTKAWKGQPTASPGADPAVGLHRDADKSKVGSVYFDGQNATVTFIANTFIANYVAPHVGRVVVDQTGLPGAFDFHVTVPVDAERAADPSIPEAVVATKIVTDFIGRLGLKLEPQRAIVPILVVDRAERPDEN